ncbi:MAG: PilX N-terminal domain-containing pilus assembly protein [Halopseudomonas sabulinigri]
MRYIQRNPELQQGSALVVALIILLMVSVLGISAMRSSIFSTKVATGIQADTMTFDAAESAVALSLKELRGFDDTELSAAVLNGEAIETCLLPNGTLKQGACGASDHMDSRELLRAGSYMTHLQNNCRMVSGSDVEIYRDYVIDILGESDMQSYGIEDHHLQEALKIGLDCIEI